MRYASKRLLLVTEPTRNDNPHGKKPCERYDCYCFDFDYVFCLPPLVQCELIPMTLFCAPSFSAELQECYVFVKCLPVFNLPDGPDPVMS